MSIQLESQYPQDYKYTVDWFTAYIPEWKALLGPYVDQPDLNFLEIGSFEGRSSVWLMENVLTQPTSTLTCIDPFIDNLTIYPDGISPVVVNCWDNFHHNIRHFQSRVNVHRGISGEILRNLPLYSFDFIYIDGSHKAIDVLEDSILSFRLLKESGILLWDDYWYDGYNQPFTSMECAKPAIDIFLKIYSAHYSLLRYQGNQVAIKKNTATELH